MTPVRTAAFATLHAVEQGAHASDLLRSAAAPLAARDAGLAEQIVMGVLRFQAQLDFLIGHYSGRAPESLDAPVRIAVRMAIFQLRYLDRIPPHAAVTESVELVKRARKASAAGFVNAVLRKVDRRPISWPDRAVELSHPAWMLERWERQYGVETATALARANLAPPETYVRVPPGHAPPAEAQSCEEVPGCYRLPASSAGGAGFRIQDISSQSIVPLLDLQPGQTFLDLCAAPGNKTAQALETGVVAVAADIHLRRLKPLRTLPARLVVLDGTAPLPFSRRFDRILVDAPCSGTGTLGRNPEIKWRLSPEALTELPARQRLLLTHALAVLAPGGRLVYSTCSLEHEENEDVVAGFDVLRTWQRIPGRDRGDGFFAAVIESR